MTLNRYIRLILLCTTSIIFCAVLLLGILAKHIQIGFTSWSSWADSSWDWSHVEVLSRDDIDTMSSRKTLVLLQLLPLPILAFHFFLFFGFGGEAIRHYQRTISVITGVARPRNLRDSEFDLEPSRVSTITGKVPTSKRSGAIWNPQPEASWQSLPRFIPPPPLTLPMPALTSGSFVIIGGSTSPPLPPTPCHSITSSNSSRTSLGVSMGHFPYPPPHFYHDQSSPLPSSIPAIAPEVHSASERSRFSLYSENSPVQERQERRYTRMFSLGRRPDTS